VVAARKAVVVYSLPAPSSSYAVFTLT